MLHNAASTRGTSPAVQYSAVHPTSSRTVQRCTANALAFCCLYTQCIYAMKFINPAFGVVRACASTRSATSSNTHFGLFLLPAYSNNAILMAPSASATPPFDGKADDLFPVAVISTVTLIRCLSGLLARMTCSGLHLWKGGVVLLVLRRCSH